jgi:hypothetical protein
MDDAHRRAAQVDLHKLVDYLRTQDIEFAKGYDDAKAITRYMNGSAVRWEVHNGMMWYNVFEHRGRFYVDGVYQADTMRIIYAQRQNVVEHFRLRGMREIALEEGPIFISVRSNIEGCATLEWGGGDAATSMPDHVNFGYRTGFTPVETRAIRRYTGQSFNSE